MSLLAAIRAIFEILERVNTIQNLLGGNAPSTISVADVERVVRGENAQFFAAIAYADIETYHNQFYKNWLISITRHNSITAEDINSPTGSLYLIYQNLIRVKTDLALLLNRLREVFWVYQLDLHVDDLVGGIFAFMHGFGLLIHIHGVYAELRRIQVGAPTLDDDRLLPDTSAALQYIADAETAVTLFIINSTAQSRRLDLVTPLRRHSDTPQNPTRWSFTDTYAARASTPADASLLVPRRSQLWASSQAAQNARDQHVRNVVTRSATVFITPAMEMLGQYRGMYGILIVRLITQQGEWVITREMQLKLDAGELEEESGGYEDGGVVPFDGDEFVSLSEMLRKAAAGEGK